MFFKGSKHQHGTGDRGAVKVGLFVTVRHWNKCLTIRSRIWAGNPAQRSHGLYEETQTDEHQSICLPQRITLKPTRHYVFHLWWWRNWAANKREELVWRISDRRGAKLVEMRHNFSPTKSWLQQCAERRIYIYWSRRSAVAKLINKTIIGEGASWAS